MKATRQESDSMGTVEVPEDALYGAQTQRAVDNFAIGQRPMPLPFLRALVAIKAAAASANGELGELDSGLATAIAQAARGIDDETLRQHFPVDVFQTGSGTSSNMNANEVIARLASDIAGEAVHPNDHVNRGQSSNDVIPSALQLSALCELQMRLLPALADLEAALERREEELAEVTKTGRTHLMDATPIRFSQALASWRQQIAENRLALEPAIEDLSALPLGGTAVGNGLNSHPEMARLACQHLAERLDVPLHPHAHPGVRMSAQDGAVRMAGQLAACATALNKIANDLRWMNSGPLAGIGEIELEALQPGSSIMPGKVNPVIPEAVAMAAVQVLGNAQTVQMAGASGNFELNVMLPLIADRLLDSLQLLTGASRSLADQAIPGFSLRRDNIEAPLSRNPILVTALNPVIGYNAAAAIAKRAYAEGRPVIDVAAEDTDLSREELQKLLNPATMTGRDA
ncbi:MAG: class II fumarate hydratase [Pseudomonadota bacterium]